MKLTLFQWYCSFYRCTCSKYLFPTEYEGHFDSVLIDHADIRQRVNQLAQVLHSEYKGIRPVLICTLKGACTFFVHLTDSLQELRQGYDIEFVRASSYDGLNTTGNVTLCSELLNLKSIQGRHVIIVEDIVDTGTTLSHIVPIIKQQGQPETVEVCTLLDKRLDEGDVKTFVPKYCGFSIPNLFIIGYG
jgi:hypoxanthine phosphoribosyltransferase